VFRVGVGRDLRAGEAVAVHDLALELLDEAPGVEWEFLPEHTPELSSAAVADFDAIMIWEPGGVTAATLAGADRLRLIARFGMGLDAIDLAACAARGVMVSVAPDSVSTSVPTAAMALLLALAHRIPEKDRLVREGRWDERIDYVGRGTFGRTLGVIGIGNVGSAVLRMAVPFGLRLLSFDPHAHSHPHQVPAGVEEVDLATLLGRSDFVLVACPLTVRTRGLIDAEALATMAPHAYLVNIARGPIVDDIAVAAAIRAGRLAGAALDVFDPEPIAAGHPLLDLPQTILTPHAAAYTSASLRRLGATACGAVLAVARGEEPAHLVGADSRPRPG
jgi:phosphoglycerate dehydrogenase-like enzyme